MFVDRLVFYLFIRCDNTKPIWLLICYFFQVFDSLVNSSQKQKLRAKNQSQKLNEEVEEQAEQEEAATKW